MIHYIIGDATDPRGFGNKLIIHVCNNKGAWGGGFTGSLSHKWKQPEYYYRRKRRHILGDVQFVQVKDENRHNIIVANMIAQVLGDKTGVNLRYVSLYKCLIAVNEYAIKHNCTIHAPRFGAGLGGGDWNLIEQKINRAIDVPIYIYDL